MLNKQNDIYEEAKEDVRRAVETNKMLAPFMDKMFELGRKGLPETEEEKVCEKCGEELGSVLLGDEVLDKCSECGHINF